MEFPLIAQFRAPDASAAIESFLMAANEYFWIQLA
jgi:hypothetical protein